MAREIPKDEFAQQVAKILHERLVGLPEPKVYSVGSTLLSAVPAAPVGACTIMTGTGAMQCIDGLTRNQCEMQFGGSWDPGTCDRLKK